VIDPIFRKKRRGEVGDSSFAVCLYISLESRKFHMSADGVAAGSSKQTAV